MLGFRSSKCKTACRLCVSRIKLNRNKREIQLTQQRREIANLLKQGKNEYAWIRVEAIIREKNLLAAYEILELYLELIAVRVELIDKHKTCPRDMVEAITTIMYATPRVADLPELVEVRKWLNVKFGRELGVEGGRNFDGEEPPAWQVNVRLRQFLAIEAPEVEDKLTMISKIAEEAQLDFNLDVFAESVMVQLDPLAAPPPPIPQPPTFQNTAKPQTNTAAGPPPKRLGAVPPSRVAPSSPTTFEPTVDAPIAPRAQPSANILRPPTIPHTDPVGITPPPPPSDPRVDGNVQVPHVPPSAQQQSFNTLQQRYDDVPEPPKKEAYHEESEEQEEPSAPPATPGLPSVPPVAGGDSGGLDSDLSRRLADLRKR